MIKSILRTKLHQFKKKHLFPELQSLEGKILEIGFGNGETLNFYNSNSTVYAIEINREKLSNAKKQNTLEYVKILEGDCQNLAFDDNYFDCVVVIFILCSVKNMNHVIQEIKRVTKKGATIIILEHTVSPFLPFRVLQYILSFIRTNFSKKCSLVNDPFRQLAKFTIVDKFFVLNLILEYCILKKIIKQ